MPLRDSTGIDHLQQKLGLRRVFDFGIAARVRVCFGFLQGFVKLHKVSDFRILRRVRFQERELP